MNWSLSDYTAPPNADESYKQMCGGNGLDLAWVGNRVMVERNRMVESGAVEHNCSGAERKGSDVDRKERIADRRWSIIDRNGDGVSSAVAPSTS